MKYFIMFIVFVNVMNAGGGEELPPRKIFDNAKNNKLETPKYIIITTYPEGSSKYKDRNYGGVYIITNENEIKDIIKLSDSPGPYYLCGYDFELDIYSKNNNIICGSLINTDCGTIVNENGSFTMRNSMNALTPYFNMIVSKSNTHVVKMFKLNKMYNMEKTSKMTNKYSLYDLKLLDFHSKISYFSEYIYYSKVTNNQNIKIKNHISNAIYKSEKGNNFISFEIRDGSSAIPYKNERKHYINGYRIEMYFNTTANVFEVNNYYNKLKELLTYIVYSNENVTNIIYDHGYGNVDMFNEGRVIFKAPVLLKDENWYSKYEEN